MSANTITPAAKSKRLLGFDFWRFFGSFMVFVIHNVSVMNTAAAAYPEVMTVNSLFERMTHPTLITLIGSSAVPMFLYSQIYSIREMPWRGLAQARPSSIFCATLPMSAIWTA